MSNGSRTNLCYLSNDAICILKPVDRKIILPRVIILPHFPLDTSSVVTAKLPAHGITLSTQSLNESSSSLS